MNSNLLDDDAWVPSTCILPTEAQPLRLAEFDDLFAQDVVGLTRPATTRLRFELRPNPGAVGRAASLAVRETDCCSFFRFDLTICAGEVGLTISTADTHADVLAALGTRAESLIAGATA